MTIPRYITPRPVIKGSRRRITGNFKPVIIETEVDINTEEDNTLVEIKEEPIISVEEVELEDKE